MLAAATSLRARFPAARIVFVSDRGKEAECEQSARSVNAYFVSMPTTASNNYDANDFEAEHGTESLAVLLRGANCPPVRFRLLSSTEVSASRPMRWLVKGVLPADGFAAMFGPSRSGKSFLALDLCAAIAGGEVWFGKRVTRAPVTYVCLEGEAGLGKRLTAWRQHHGRGLPDGLRWITAAVDLRRAIDRTELATAMVAQSAVNGLLVIDTLNRAAPGADENSSSDMGDIIESCSELQRAVGGMVMVIHHTGKDGAKGLRGHSSLLASLDAAIEVSRVGTQRQWSVAKCKDDADGVSCSFRLQPVDVCQDEWGGVESSCAVVADVALARATRSARPRGQNQRAAFDALAAPLAQTTLIGQGSAPSDARCLPLRRALEIVRSRLGGDERHRMEKASLAVNGLKGRGIYGGDDDWLWTT
ncbi:AAA family ATPase [Caballeronia sordidicola]|nr:AAA family ATPase [Caballeronia sordidicola]